MTVLFWLIVGTIAYAYAGYPVVAWLAGRLLDRRVRRAPVEPTVSVVVAAYDEAEGIAARIENLLAADYPAQKLQIVVASDGSTDATVSIARSFEDPRVVVLDLPRVGKAEALARGARRADGDILVFTDANTVFRRDAIRMLVRNFADPEVGGVVGRTGYDVDGDTASAGRGEDLYWRYDSWLKSLESRTGSVVSAHGGMYALRRELFREVEDPAVTDDFAISTAVVDQGKRLVFEEDAVGSEETMGGSALEFHRRVRLMTRGLRGVLLRRRLLDPFAHGFYAVALFSRKLLRRVLPVTFVPLYLVTWMLASAGTLYGLVAVSMSLFLIAACVGGLLRETKVGALPVLYVPYFFCLANLASLLALANTLRGERIERWTPQRHTSSAPGARAGSPSRGSVELSRSGSEAGGSP